MIKFKFIWIKFYFIYSLFKFPVTNSFLEVFWILPTITYNISLSPNCLVWTLIGVVTLLVAFETGYSTYIRFLTFFGAIIGVVTSLLANITICIIRIKFHIFLCIAWISWVISCASLILKLPVFSWTCGCYMSWLFT